MAVFVIGILLFLAVEYCAEHPLVDLKLFRAGSLPCQTLSDLYRFLTLYGGLFYFAVFAEYSQLYRYKGGAGDIFANDDMYGAAGTFGQEAGRSLRVENTS